MTEHGGPVITCPNCGKENQDHYKFCLACGTRLGQAMAGGVPPPPPVGGSGRPPPPPPPVASGTGYPPPPPPPPNAGAPPPAPPPVHGGPPPVMGAPEGPPPAAGQSTACSNCAMVNPPGFMFCGRCGNRLAAPPVSSRQEMGSAQTIYVGADDDGGFPTQPPVEPEAETLEQQALPPPVVGGPPVPAPVQPESTQGPAARLVMLGPDGQPIGERVLAAGEKLEVGREAGPPWDDDAYLDPRHAVLTPTEDGILVEDFDSLNGIFLKLLDRMEIQHGDQFRVGQELLLYEDLPEPTPTDDGTERMGSPNPGYWGRVSILVDPDRPSAAFPIAAEGISVGRDHGEITFPTDGYVSGHHCRIFGDDEGIYMEDVGSSNGTYMRVRSGQIVPYGSLVLIGQKLFQLELAD